MPWKLDRHGGPALNSPDFAYDEGQDTSVTLPRGRIPTQEHWPVRISVTSRHKTVPQFTTGPTTSVLIVSRQFRDLVEAYDSAEHSYVPVQMTMKNGEVLNDAYFLFTPQGHLENGLVVEESDVREFFIGGKFIAYLNTSLRPRLMWRKSVVGDRHLWTDKYLKEEIVVSDELYAEFVKHKIEGFQAHESRFSEVVS